MKSQLLFLLALSLSLTVLAQKKELKIAEKALKKSNFTTTLSTLKSLETLIENADDKLKEKYYYLKAKAIYANGSAIAKDNLSGKAFAELLAFEKKSGTKKYKEEAGTLLNGIIQRTNKSASDFYSNKDYKKASEKFELVYSLSKKDTTSLENAAMSAYFDENYEKSIDLYAKLLKMGYTGIEKRFKALSTVNDEVLYYNTKKDMDRQVMLKIAKQPETVVSESRTGTIARNIALSYIAKGDEQGALKAISDAKKIFPNDCTLVISEANIYFKLGDNEKFLEGLKKAIELKPNDAQLHYNVGVLTMQEGFTEKAIVHFKDAIRLKPDYADAYNNIGIAILRKEGPIVDEMNENLSNFKKYDELVKQQKEIYREALPYYEDAHKYDEKSPEAMKTLIGLYELLEMYDEQKEIKEKLDSL